MPASTPVHLIAPVLPNGFCPDSEQARANAYFGLAQAYLDQIYTTIIVSNNLPPVADRGKLWFIPNEGRFYFWDGTSWLSPYWFDPGLSMFNYNGSIFVPIDAAQLAFIDNPGGGGPILGLEDRTGEFWQENEDLRARFPLGAGTLQPSNTPVAAGATGGVDQTTISPSQGGINHRHAFGLMTNQPNDDSRFLIGASIPIPSTSSIEIHGDTGNPLIQNIATADLITSLPVVGGSVSSGTPDPLNLMNPYLVGTWAKRTARKYFSH